MNPLQSRLASLRHRIRSVTLFRGVSLVLAILIGSALLAGWLDWTMHFPALIRALLLLLILGGSIAVAFLALFSPLKAKADDLALALKVEEEYPILNDSLASTVQFIQLPGDAPGTGSPTLRQEAIQRALRLAQGCDFNRVVNTRGLRLSGFAAATILVLAGLMALWYPSIVRSAVLRLVHPFGEHDWETQTQLALDFSKRVSSASQFEIKGKVTGVIPKHATLRLKGYSLGDLPAREYPIMVSEDGTEGTFVARLDLTDQREKFQFFVETGDARKPHRPGKWFTVEVAPPPRLIAVDGVPPPQKITLDIPSYTGLKTPQYLAAGTKQIDAIEGTQITLEAVADRPLKTAWIQLQPNSDDSNKISPIDAAKLGVLGLPDPWQVLATRNISEQAWTRFPVQLDASGTKLTAQFRPWLSGTHVLYIEDESGLPNQYNFKIQLLSDPSPLVNLEQPATNRNLLPNAEVSLQISAEDKLFALRSVFLEYWRKDKTGQLLDHKINRLLLFDEGLVEQGFADGVTDFEGNPITLLEPMQKLRLPFVKLKKRWSLEGLVKEGEILVIRAGADDFNNVSAFNIPGYSHEVELTIVGKTEMNADLDKTQAKLQEKVTRLKELQESALKNVKEVEKNLVEKNKLSTTDLKKLLDKLLDAEQWQKEIQEMVGKDKTEGMLKELDQIDQVIKDNKIISSSAKDNVKLLKNELKRLVDEHLQMIGPELNKAKQELNSMEPPKAEEKKDAKEDLNSAKKHQQQVLKSLDELLNQMDRLAGLRKIRQEAQTLMQEQIKVNEGTEKLNEKFEPLDKNWQAKLDQVADQQQQLATDAQRLLDKLKKTSEEKVEKEPEIAKMLEEAFQIGQEMKLPGEMKSSDDRLRKKQLLSASNQQKQSVKTLKQMVDSLTEKREEQLAKLVENQEKAKGGLKEFEEKIEKLQKKIEDAQKIADPEKRKQELKNLTDQQKQLLDEAKKKAQELARLRAEEAKKELEDAAKHMEDALKKMQMGGDPLEDQQQAKQKVKNAEEKLKKAQKEAEEELAREKLAKIADQIKGLKERQDEAITETSRLHGLIMKKGWTGEEQGSFLNHKTVQETLSKETASLAQKLKGAKVFELILTKAGGNMEESVKSMRLRLSKSIERRGLFPWPPEMQKDEIQSHDIIVKYQKQASDRLQSLIEAVKEAQKQQAEKDENKDPDNPEGNPEDQPQGGLQAQDGIPGIAQLKALKAEQELVNQRTKAFAKTYPNKNNLPPEAQAELNGIHSDQEALFELFREIAAAANQGEKK